MAAIWSGSQPDSMPSSISAAMVVSASRWAFERRSSNSLNVENDAVVRATAQKPPIRSATAPGVGVTTCGVPSSWPKGPPSWSQVTDRSRTESHKARRTPARGLASSVTEISCTVKSRMKSLCAPPEGRASTAR